MNKERKVTNAVIVFDRDVKASELNTILDGFNGDVVIRKNLEIDTHLHLECNLYVMLSIFLDHANGDCTIYIGGDLWCGDMDCYDIYVQGSLYCNGEMDATNITVGEDLCCNDSIKAYSYRIIVAGDLSSYAGIIADTVHVLGKIDIDGGLTIDSSIKSGY